MTFRVRVPVAVAHTITGPASPATKYDGLSIRTSTAECEKKMHTGYISAEVIFGVYLLQNLLQSLNRTQLTIQHNMHICGDILLSSS